LGFSTSQQEQDESRAVQNIEGQRLEPIGVTRCPGTIAETIAPVTPPHHKKPIIHIRMLPVEQDRLLISVPESVDEELVLLKISASTLVVDLSYEVVPSVGNIHIIIQQPL
jgi:hypothetical protein